MGATAQVRLLVVEFSTTTKRITFEDATLINLTVGNTSIAQNTNILSDVHPLPRSTRRQPIEDWPVLLLFLVVANLHTTAIFIERGWTVSVSV